ncbi:UNVERIFIED_CONTAM: hypothetical protein FKN15_045549 [Acipenser sinensis]
MAGSEKLTPFLLDTVVLELVNYSTMSQAVTECLTEFDIEFNKASWIVTNNATYCTKAYNEVLRGLLPNLVHVTCNAHIASMASNQLRIHFSEADKCVAAMKTILKHCPARKQRFKAFLAEKQASPD